MNANRPAIGYIGIGLMGMPMLRRLAALGYRLSAYDIAVDRMREAAALGARAAISAGDCARGVGCVALNLPTVDAVEVAVFGEGGAAATMDPTQHLVDFSTIPVDRAKAFAARLRSACGAHWVDAPVSGGPPAAGDGTLTVMAGGEADDIAALRPFFAEISGRFTHMGPVGAGLAAKMINQLIVGCAHAVMAEALVLAEAAGIDGALIPECLAGGHADSAALQKIYPRMQRRQFAPQGYLRQLDKDLEMVHAYAAGLKAPTPMMSQAAALYRMAMHLGYAGQDTAAIVRLYAKSS